MSQADTKTATNESMTPVAGDALAEPASTATTVEPSASETANSGTAPLTKTSPRSPFAAEPYVFERFSVLFVPARQHDLLFTHDAAVVQSDDKIIRLTVPLPPLVFVGVGLIFHLWALDTDDFQPTAKLYHAPLPNVHADGQICWGSNPAPNAERIAYAWRLFIAAPFNGDLCSGKSRSYPNDVRVKLRDLAQRKRRTYPLRDLMPCTTTVEQAVNTLLRRIM